jgi:excisionase family DNA binding protein
MSIAVIDPDDILNAEGLGARLRVGKSTIYKMHSKGLIPSLPVGAGLRGRRFSFSAVCEALEKLQTTKRPYYPPKDRPSEAVTA